MAFSLLPSSVVVTAAIVLPHIALARYFGISLTPVTIPEPLPSLLLLLLISSFTLVFLKPLILNFTVSSSPTSKTRHVASWASSNAQCLVFAFLSDELVGRWPCPPGREPEYHQNQFVNVWRSVSGALVFCAIFLLNVVYAVELEYLPGPANVSAVASLPSIEPDEKEAAPLEVETGKE